MFVRFRQQFFIFISYFLIFFSYYHFYCRLVAQVGTSEGSKATEYCVRMLNTHRSVEVARLDFKQKPVLNVKINRKRFVCGVPCIVFSCLMFYLFLFFSKNRCGARRRDSHFRCRNIELQGRIRSEKRVRADCTGWM